MTQQGTHQAWPFIAEVRLFGSEQLPDGWHPCDGAELPIAEHQPLFSLLRFRFGGDGWTTFALPALRLERGPEVVFAIALHGVMARRGDDQ